MDEVKIKCDALLDKYSLTEISKLTCIDISKVHRILKSHLNEKTPKEYSWKLSDELIDEVKDFYQSPQISYNIAHFLKSVINFVQSNDIQCEFCVDQSNEMFSLLYYRDCFNL